MATREVTHDPAITACAGCSLEPDRRAFIREATRAVSGALAAIGVSAEIAHALSVTAVVPIGSRTAATHAYPIPTADGVQIDRENKVILVRWLDVVYAFALSCPHQNTALTWLEKAERFQCPKHRSEYSPDGYFITGRATRGMDRYAVHRDGNTIVADLSVLRKESDDANGWKAACVTLS